MPYFLTEFQRLFICYNCNSFLKMILVINKKVMVIKCKFLWMHNEEKECPNFLLEQLEQVPYLPINYF